MKSNKTCYWVEDLKKLSSRNVGTPLIKLLAIRNPQNTASEDQNIRKRGKSEKSEFKKNIRYISPITPGVGGMGEALNYLPCALAEFHAFRST